MSSISAGLLFPQRPAFASHSGAAGDLGSFYRECQTAPPLELFSNLQLDDGLVRRNEHDSWVVLIKLSPNVFSFFVAATGELGGRAERFPRERCDV